MNNIMIMYHPVKKEIHFLVDDNGSFNEINYTDSPYLEEYSPEYGEFILQYQGRKFFDNLTKAFLNINKKTLIFKGTKLDYEDFKKMVDNYNKTMKREKTGLELKLGDFLELPEVSLIYDAIKEVSNGTVQLFENELPDGDVKKIFRDRKEKLDEKVREIEKDNVNLCFVGTYSSGKSAFINALIGERILPEKIRPETAKMFRVQNSDCPSINFTVKKDHEDRKGKIGSIVWVEELGMFQFTTSVNDGIKGKIDKVCQKSAKQPRFVQMRNILTEINNMPNGYNLEDKDYVEGMIDIHYPMDLAADINFTFYDTPGTDSNSSEHLRILKSALAQQTNSILIVMYEPLKMEGKGNSVLFDLMQKSQEDTSNEEGVTIDLSRSIHVINQSDRFGSGELRDVLCRPIKVSRNVKDSLDENELEEFEYDLQEKRVFYVSSKAAYCAKALKKGICDEDDEEFIDETKDKVIKRRYYKYNHMSDAEFETEEIINDSQSKFDSQKAEDIAGQMYVASGMYAIEQEIVKYAEKYALAVKAKGLYDAVLFMMDGVEGQYRIIENSKGIEKKKLQAQIDDLRKKMTSDIEDCYASFVDELVKGEIDDSIPELNYIQTRVTNKQNAAEKEVGRLPKIVIKAEKIQEKNKIIINNLNSYISELDDYYFNIREKILAKQMGILKGRIAKKVEAYKEIDQAIIERILSVGETHVPKSKITGVTIDDYINAEKPLWIFTTTDKAKYKETVTANFMAMTGRQYKEYIKEIKDVAKEKATDMKEEFIKNIDEVSATLEDLMNNVDQVAKDQAEARRCLDLATGKIETLENQIWRCKDE